MQDLSSIAYLAGLFDGEGSVYFKKTKQIRHKRPGKPVHNITVIRMEISMTDESIIKWVHEVLGCGTVGKRKFKSDYAKGWKQQWRWRCCHRDAFFVARLLWPYVHVKLPQIEKIINHYDIDSPNVISLDEYRASKRK